MYAGFAFSPLSGGDALRFIDATLDPGLRRLSPALAETAAEAVAAGEAPETFCLRVSRPYVLLGPQDLRLPHPEQGVAWLASQGLPAYVRVGGGAAVLLDEGCLSFFAAVPCRDIGRLDRNFRDLTQPVRQALAQLGLHVRFGRAPGSYCEGPQDLVTRGGRKLLGVAQAMRHGYAIVSGMLLLSQDPWLTTEVLQEFYRRSGSDRVLRADAVTSADIELGRSLPMETAKAAIMHQASALGWDAVPSPLTVYEVEVGERLLTARRFPGRDLARRMPVRSL
jgi:lipoate-protein ligase A